MTFEGIAETNVVEDGCHEVVSIAEARAEEECDEQVSKTKGQQLLRD